MRAWSRYKQWRQGVAWGSPRQQLGYNCRELSLAGATNPQARPCGYYGDPLKECICTPTAVTRYKKRISGPLLDRIDLFVEVPRVDYDKLVSPTDGEASAEVTGRVERARGIQQERFDGLGIITNAEMGPVEVWKHWQVDDMARGLLQTAMRQLHLSARGFHRVLKLSRTMADPSAELRAGLAGAEGIAAVHRLAAITAGLAEALQYRPRAFG